MLIMTTIIPFSHFISGHGFFFEAAMPVSETVPLLPEVTEVFYSAPVTNAWPERGVFNVKWIKTKRKP